MEAVAQRQVRIGRCIDKIVDEIHTPLLRELARLAVALHEARCFFGDDSGHQAYRLFVIAYTDYRTATEAHVFKEEVEIFPRLRLGIAPPAASLYVMRLEHDAEDESLNELVRLARACLPTDESRSAWLELVTDVEELASFQRSHAEEEEGTLLPLALGD